MSKYARTRKSICRRLKIDKWNLPRSQFKKDKPLTYKEYFKGWVTKAHCGSRRRTFYGGSPLKPVPYKEGLYPWWYNNHAYLIKYD